MKPLMKLIIIMCSILIPEGLLLSCSAEDGEDGAMGLQGDPGPQGPEGEQGEPGTANVMYSEWLDVEWNGADESAYKRMDIVEPLITEEFMETGTVLMYLNLSGGSQGIVFALPFSTDSGQAFTFFMRPEGFTAPLPGTFPEDAGLSFYIEREGGVASGGIGPIRYVLIPGGTDLSSISGTSTAYSKMTYRELASHFNIPD
jgi:hypothetical protein